MLVLIVLANRVFTAAPLPAASLQAPLQTISQPVKNVKQIPMERNTKPLSFSHPLPSFTRLSFFPSSGQALNPLLHLRILASVCIAGQRKIKTKTKTKTKTTHGDEVESRKDLETTCPGISLDFLSPCFL